MQIPEDCRYTKEHEWIRAEGPTAVVGITAYASEQLGGITYVGLPTEGAILAQGAVLAEVESVKAVSDVYSPAGGKVAEINAALEDKPELIDESPYDKGWLCKIELSGPDELETLMDAASYRDYLDELAQ